MNPTFTGVDLGTINTCELRSLHCYVATNGYVAPTLWSNPGSWGVILPGNQNGGNVAIGTLGVYGYFTGIAASERMCADNILQYWNQTAVGLDQAGNHESYIRYLQTSGNAQEFGQTGGTVNVINPAASGSPTLVIGL